MSKNKKAIKGKPTKAAKVKTPAKKVKKPASKVVTTKKPSPAAAKSSVKPAKSAKNTSAKTNVKSAKKAAPAKQKAVKQVAKKKVNSPKVVAKTKAVPQKKLPAKPVKAPKPARAEPPKKMPVKPKAPSKYPNEPKPTAEEKLRKSEEAATKKQLIEKKAQDVLAITNTIPVKEKPVISASRIASISHSITNPVKRSDSYSVRVEKEPNGKFELEFVVHASADMLYEFLSTPSGLSEWFCDDLNIRNGIYTFIWEDTLQQARLLKTIELQLVRFQWVDKTDGSYFEFRIQRDDLTNDISLIITDFADSVSERESAKLLWHSQIEKLMHVIGSIF